MIDTAYITTRPSVVRTLDQRTYIYKFTDIIHTISSNTRKKLTIH